MEKNNGTLRVVLMSLILVAAIVVGLIAVGHRDKENLPEGNTPRPTDSAEATDPTAENGSSTLGTSEPSTPASTTENNTSAAQIDTSRPEASEATRSTSVKNPELTYIRGILVVNKSYAIPSDYGSGITPEAQKAFDELAADAAADGINLWIRSGYRSYDYQKQLYNNYVARDGKAAADRYSARPGHSEHQTGLAMDVNSLSESFGETKEGKWLAENCWKYGFIIRYPKGKENITGYIYEPWHIRYLGKENAKAVYESGLTLEEYLGIDSKYAY